MQLLDYHALRTRRVADLKELINDWPGNRGWKVKDVDVKPNKMVITMQNLTGVVTVNLFTLVSGELLMAATKEFVRYQSPVEMLAASIRAQAMRKALEGIQVPDQVWKTRFPHTYAPSQMLVNRHIPNDIFIPSSAGFAMIFNATLAPEKGTHTSVFDLVEQRSAEDIESINWAKQTFGSAMGRVSYFMNHSIFRKDESDLTEDDFDGLDFDLLFGDPKDFDFFEKGNNPETETIRHLREVVAALMRQHLMRQLKYSLI